MSVGLGVGGCDLCPARSL